MINIVLTKEFIKNDKIQVKMQFLDLRNIIIEIINPIKTLINEYTYPNLGLIKPNGDRGELCINVIDSFNLILSNNDSLPKVIISFI